MVQQGFVSTSHATHTGRFSDLAGSGGVCVILQAFTGISSYISLYIQYLLRMFTLFTVCRPTMCTVYAHHNLIEMSVFSFISTAIVRPRHAIFCVNIIIIKGGAS